jgi:hypothetical protein
MERSQRAARAATTTGESRRPQALARVLPIARKRLGMDLMLAPEVRPEGPQGAPVQQALRRSPPPSGGRTKILLAVL